MWTRSPVREGNTLTADNPVSDFTHLPSSGDHATCKQNRANAQIALKFYDCNFVIATSRWLLRSCWKTTHDWFMRMICHDVQSVGRARDELHVSLFTRHARPETFVKTSVSVTQATRYSSLHNVFHIKNAKKKTNHVIVKWKTCNTIRLQSFLGDIKRERVLIVSCSALKYLMSLFDKVQQDVISTLAKIKQCIQL